MMQERNLELEFKIKHYNQPRYRPKTAPARPRVIAASTPISTYNDSIQQAPQNKRQTKSQLPPPRDATFTFLNDITNTIQPALHSRHSTTHHSPMIPSYSALSPFQRVLLHPKTASNLNSHTQACSATSNERQYRYENHLQVAHDHNISSATLGPVELSSITSQHSLISLTEARRRAKPLPPLGPMSPSVVKGVVEIGDPRQKGDEVVEKRKRGLSGLFTRRKKDAFLVSTLR